MWLRRGTFNLVDKTPGGALYTAAYMAKEEDP
jgi:hypothetical protein